MEETELKVEGMMCEACVGHVQKALAAVPGVTMAQVSLTDQKAVVSAANASVQAMIEAVEEEGYTARLIA